MKPTFLIWLRPTSRKFIVIYLRRHFPAAGIEICNEINMREKYRRLKNPIFISQSEIANKKHFASIIEQLIAGNKSAKNIFFNEVVFGKILDDITISIIKKKQEIKFNEAIAAFFENPIPRKRIFYFIGIGPNRFLAIPSWKEGKPLLANGRVYNTLKDSQCILL